jgi:hypothetical protein
MQLQQTPKIMEAMWRKHMHSNTVNLEERINKLQNARRFYPSPPPPKKKKNLSVLAYVFNQSFS